MSTGIPGVPGSPRPPAGRPTMPGTPLPPMQTPAVGVAPAMNPATAPQVTAPQASLPASGPVATPPAAGGTKERKKREVKILPMWAGAYFYENGQVAYDNVQGADGVVSQKPRLAKLEGAVALVTLDADGKPVAGDARYNPNEHARLKPSNFKKRGDFYRYEAAVHGFRYNESLHMAKMADEGKLRAVRNDGVKAKMLQLLQQLQATMPADQYAAIAKQFGEGLIAGQQAAAPAA